MNFLICVLYINSYKYCVVATFNEDEELFWYPILPYLNGPDIGTRYGTCGFVIDRSTGSAQIVYTKTYPGNRHGTQEHFCNEVSNFS